MEIQKDGEGLTIEKENCHNRGVNGHRIEACIQGRLVQGLSEEDLPLRDSITGDKEGIDPDRGHGHVTGYQGHMTGEEGRCHVITDRGHVTDVPVIGGTIALDHDHLYEGYAVKNHMLLTKLKGELVEVTMRKREMWSQIRKMSWKF